MATGLAGSVDLGLAHSRSRIQTSRLGGSCYSVLHFEEMRGRCDGSSLLGLNRKPGFEI